MEGDFIKINEWLLPFSWLYGCAVRFRNFLFEVGVLKSRAFDVPVISVGNITVGGTGKTPHVEYLIRLLQDKVKVAVLLATADTPMRKLGDEPFQMKQKYPNVTVAVDKKRVRGIRRLTDNSVVEDIDVILLDDAFQHRYVNPGINILLVDYHRLIIYDKLLPAGRLREPLVGKNRADVVIITKCPKNLKPMEFRVIMKAMSLFPYQQLFFTTLDYDPLQPLFGGKPRQLSDMKAGEHVLLLTGIASPEQIKLDITEMADCQLTALDYPDHHNFKRKDAERINREFASLPEPRCIITTEKDATRLQTLDGLSDEVKASLYVLPVRIRFMQDQEESFNQNILGYVRKNSRNSILVKAKDDHKSKDSHCAGDRSRTISFRNN